MANMFPTTSRPRGGLAAAARQMRRPGWRPALSGILLTMAVYAIGRPLGLFDRDGPPPQVISRHFIVGARPTASGGRGGETADRFDRLRIPPDTTEMQLSFAVDAPPRGARFETEIEPVDDGIVRVFATEVESARGGSIAKVTVPAPPDGDYVLRLHQIAGARAEVVMTKAFRLTRGAEGASR